MHDDERSPAEEMVHELGIGPALDDRIDDSPLLRQARKNVDDTVRQSHEKHDRDHPPSHPSR
jgi:hypothetical protein